MWSQLWYHTILYCDKGIISLVNLMLEIFADFERYEEGLIVSRSIQVWVRGVTSSCEKDFTAYLHIMVPDDTSSPDHQHKAMCNTLGFLHHEVSSIIDNYQAGYRFPKISLDVRVIMSIAGSSWHQGNVVKRSTLNPVGKVGKLWTLINPKEFLF